MSTARNNDESFIGRSTSNNNQCTLLSAALPTTTTATATVPSSSVVPSSRYTVIAHSNDIHGDGNFPQGCQFSPDGLCVLTSTAADATLRLYNTFFPKTTTTTSQPTEDDDDGDRKEEEVVGNNNNNDTSNNQHYQSFELGSWKLALSSRVVGDIVRSYDWYPFMESSNPTTCCFAATGRDQPIHLIDAYTGHIRATYCPYNALDEMESPTIVQFAPAGDKLIAAGFRTDRMIHLFDITRPGRSSSSSLGTTIANNHPSSAFATAASTYDQRDDHAILKLGRTKRSTDGQKGLVSALAFSSSGGPNNNTSTIMAVGTYSPGSIYVYDYRQGQHQPSGTIWNGGRCVIGHGKKHSKKPLPKKRRRRQRRLGDEQDDEKLTTARVDDPDDENNNVPDDDENTNLFSVARSRWYAHRAQRGITQLAFDDSNHYFLYSACRNADAVLVWDIRVLSGQEDYVGQPIRGYTSYATNAHTNQRLQFALDNNTQRLFVGTCDGCIRIYDTTKTPNHSQTSSLIEEIIIPECRIMGDAVNGISYNPRYPNLLAVATGSRRFPSEDDYASTEEEDDDEATKTTTAINNNCNSSNTTNDSIITTQALMERAPAPGSLQLLQLL